MDGTKRKKAIVRAFWGIRKSDLRFYAPNESYNCSLLQAGFFPSSVSYARPLMRRRRFLFFRFIIIIHVFICELRNAQSHTHTRTPALTHTKTEYPLDAALGTIKTHILRTSIALRRSSLSSTSIGNKMKLQSLRSLCHATHGSS